MEPLPKIVLERLQASAQAGPHPDPDLLTAFAENSLPEPERLPVLEHLSSCGDCRELMALAQPEMAMAHVAAAAGVAAMPAASLAAPGRRGWSSRLIFSWGAVAACIVVGVALLHFQTREKKLAQLASKQAVSEVDLGQSSSAAQYPEKGNAKPSAAPPENELSAKLEPLVSEESKLAKRRDEAVADKNSRAAPGRVTSQLMNKKLSAAGAAAGQGAGTMEFHSSPESNEQATVSAEAAPMPATRPPSADLPLQARSSREVASSDSIAAAPPPAVQQQNQAAPAVAAKAAAPRARGALVSGGAFSAQKTDLKDAQARAIQKEAMARVSSNYIPTQWTISADGATLLRSTEEGQSDVINVASNVVFRAVASLGLEVWAGGKDGALYHSSDFGAHWGQVKPAVNGTALTADIVKIEFPDPQHGKLTTAEGKVWTTSDGGKSWQTP